MKSKKRNDFVVGYYRQKITKNGINDFYAESATMVLFFLNEDQSARQVKETMQYQQNESQSNCLIEALINKSK